jgi:hypothetical protein
MSLEALRALLAKPASPIEADAPAGGWEAVERCLGVALPADYKAFLAEYGTGSVAGFFWVQNPFSLVRPWFPWLSSALSAQAVVRASSGGKSTSFPLFPEANGVLPFGHTDNGDLLGWITEGDPDEWAVLVASPRAGTEDLVMSSMSQLLADLLSGAYRCPLFPDDVARDRSFRPLAP